MLELLYQRRSVRKYQDKPIEEEKILMLKKSVLLSPSSRNRKSCEFVFVTNVDVIQSLAKTKPQGSSFIAGASLIVVIVGRPDIAEPWIEDCSIAATILQLSAEYLDLGSCWIQIRDREHNEQMSAEQYIQNLLSIDEHKRIEALMSIGYPDEIKEPHIISEEMFHKITDVK
ncbi:MAG: nitroreductase family protein [Caldisericia bacterium]|nr:nitroreductase family protein [Caldisericia bacterium]MDD4615324.1 nitroreductase family protein [Caldisericia bacterium]